MSLYRCPIIYIFVSIIILPLMETSFFDSSLSICFLMPVLIFMARICDVSIGTLRIIFVSKGKRNIAPFLGFFEVLIWITVISKIMENLHHYTNFIAYAAGFATGNFAGMIIEEKLAVGILMNRVFAHERGTEFMQTLNRKVKIVIMIQRSCNHSYMNITKR
jgi:uncharacterized protein YebE (UPF0316 family)